MTKEYADYLAHHGIKGQKWGVKHGPPYPLDDNPEKQRKQMEIKEKARNNVEVSLVHRPTPKMTQFLAKYFPGIKDRVEKDTQMDIAVRGKKVGDLEVFKESKDSLNVVWIGIDKSERGKGYASAVMSGVIKHAKKSGCKQVTLEVPGDSPDARHIYEKLGFEPVGIVSEKDDVWGGLTAMKLIIGGGKT